MIQGISNALWLMLFAIFSGYLLYGMICNDLVYVAVRSGIFGVGCVAVYAGLIFLARIFLRKIKT